MDGNGEGGVLERANKSTKEWLDRAQECMTLGKPTDAKKMVTNAQKELRALKTEVVAEEREVRAQFSEARLKANKTGQTVGLFMGSKTRGHMSRARAGMKRSIAQQQQDAMDDYRQLKTALDQGVAQLDRVKLDIDLGKFNVDAAEVEAAPGPDPVPTAVAPAAPLPPPAMWAADPSGRHELRYWSGTAWTEHVSTKGVQGVDPL